MSTLYPLLVRLDAIGAALERSGHALALLGLGSVGLETARIDAYSDLDFFAIVEPGYKARYLDNHDWLESAHPVAYAFRNTVDGFKLLYADGIFCEYAVFEPDELAAIPFSPGRVVWSAPGFDTSRLTPTPRPPSEKSVEWCLGEALTNLYVGMQRYRRGEKLAAMFLVQCYAVTRIAELAAQIEAPAAGYADAFAAERRFEARFPGIAAQLAALAQGYERTPESARAILAFLDAHFAVNAAIKAEIEKLLG